MNEPSSDKSSDPHGVMDAYAPPRIAALVESAGVRKAGLPILTTITLGVLAGAFIAFGAMFYTLVMTEHGLGFGPSRLLGGVAFSLGLILVVIGGAELFTGNNLLVMAWADGKLGAAAVLRNWLVVYVANFIGAVATALLVSWSGILGFAGGAVETTAHTIAVGKVSLSFEEALVRGTLCNTLVCLAVWLSFAARRVSGKVLAMIFPITAFVALGFEHSVANMYFIPLAIITEAPGVDMAGFIDNLIPVTLGNVIGGGGLVALVYWLCYLRPNREEKTS